MAWTSDETKMDTGQLYVTTDGGETYHKVCELKEIREIEEDSSISDYVFQQLLCNLMLDRDATLYYIGGRGHGKTRLIMEITKKLLEYKYALDKNVSKLTTKFLFGPIEGKEHDDALDALLYCIKLRDKVNKILPTDFKFVEKRVDYREKAEAEWKPFNENFEEDINKEKETKTMEARKCERCGKLYEVSRFAGRCDTHNLIPVRLRNREIPEYQAADLNENGIAKRQMEDVKIVAEDNDRNPTLALCPECRKSFAKWWDNFGTSTEEAITCEEDKSNG